MTVITLNISATWGLGDTKKSRSGGWYLAGVTTGELEIEALKSLIFENTKYSSEQQQQNNNKYNNNNSILYYLCAE
jgi:hypothetical protein